MSRVAAGAGSRVAMGGLGGGGFGGGSNVFGSGDTNKLKSP